MLAVQVNVCYILKHFKIGKHYLFIFITLIVTLSSSSSCTEELTAYALFFYTQFENSNDVTPA